MNGRHPDAIRCRPATRTGEVWLLWNMISAPPIWPAEAPAPVQIDRPRECHSAGSRSLRLLARIHSDALSAKPVFSATDLKRVKVHVFPAEGDLQYLVKLRDAGVARHQQRRQISGLHLCSSHPREMDTLRARIDGAFGHTSPSLRFPGQGAAHLAALAGPLGKPAAWGTMRVAKVSKNCSSVGSTLVRIAD